MAQLFPFMLVSIVKLVSCSAYIGTNFYENQLPLPVMYDINGVCIVGFSTTRPDLLEHSKLVENVIRENVSKLPSEFIEGLKDFYRFGNKSLPGVRFTTHPIRDMIKVQETKNVEFIPFLDKKKVNMIYSEFVQHLIQDQIQ